MRSVEPVPVPVAGSQDPAEGPVRSSIESVPRTPEQVFERYFDFVWRNARRMGVREEDVDDAVQEVFLVVHRRFESFEGRSSIETWLFSILVNVVQHFRRARARHLNRVDALTLLGEVTTRAVSGPDHLTTQRQEAEILNRLLDELDDDKRAAFVLVELEERSVPEVAKLLDQNVNTVYSRVRAARLELERAIARLHVESGEPALAESGARPRRTRKEER